MTKTVLNAPMAPWALLIAAALLSGCASKPDRVDAKALQNQRYECQRIDDRMERSARTMSARVPFAVKDVFTLESISYDRATRSEVSTVRPQQGTTAQALAKSIRESVCSDATSRDHIANGVSYVANIQSDDGKTLTVKSDAASCGAGATAQAKAPEAKAPKAESPGMWGRTKNAVKSLWPWD